MLLRFKASHQTGGKPFRVASFFKAPACSWAPPFLVLLEPILKVFGSFLGVCDEVGPPYDPIWIGEALNHSAIHGCACGEREPGP